MNSIRKNLLITLSIAFILGWIVLAGFIYAETRHEIEEIYDAELARFAEIISNIPVAGSTAGQTEEHINLINVKRGHRYANHISVQRWHDANLIYHSTNIPEYRLTTDDGYTNLSIDNEDWRFFQMTTNDNGHLIVGEKKRVRQELITNIAANSLAPMIWTLPLLLFFLHIAIRRGLKPLKQLFHEIETRDHHSLTPFPVKHAPDEVQPLIQALNRLLSRLQEAFEKESNFTADASHELRTPLAGVRSHTQLALRQSLEPHTIESLQKALAGLDRCDRLVEQMLTLHRLNPEQADEHFELINLDHLSHAVCNDLELLAGKKQIRLNRIPSDSNQPLLIFGNPHGIYILIKNIVENAINYSPKSGTVEITLANNETSIRLTVNDNGPGIPSEIKHRVFNRFFRRSDNDTPGAGLGLSIVKQLADLHQARLQLNNKPDGAGLEFTVTFNKTSQ